MNEQQKNKKCISLNNYICDNSLSYKVLFIGIIIFLEKKNK